MPPGSTCPSGGLLFPPCGVDDLPHVMRPREAGGVLEKSGVVEVVSSLERDGRPVFRDLRWGVYVVLEAPNDYAADCFKQYGLKTDASGRYAAMYKPYHLIGLELNISVLSAALRGEPTGQPHDFRGDVAAVAKRDLRSGEMLDGEGGYTVWGKLMPAAASLEAGALPIGLAHRVRLKNDIAHGAVVRWNDVEIDAGADAVATRRAMEKRFGGTAKTKRKRVAAAAFGLPFPVPHRPLRNCVLRLRPSLPLILGNWLVILRAGRDFQISIAPRPGFVGI